MPEMTHDEAEREYALSSAGDLGRQQLACLQALLDPHSTAALDAAGVRPGERCLDLGSGGGSIARLLAERVGPSGSVIAVDLDIDHLDGAPGVEVRRHDITDGVPGGGPYDVIHARLLLMHLSRRAEILAELAGALAPGGRLVIGEYCGPPLYVVSAPSSEDVSLFARMQEVTVGIGRGAGISYEWAREVDGHMAAAGLVDIHSQAHSHTTVGGSPGCLLHINYNLQVETLIRQAGVTEAELVRYRELMLDPRFRAWFYDFFVTRGRKPSA